MNNDNQLVAQHQHQHQDVQDTPATNAMPDVTGLSAPALAFLGYRLLGLTNGKALQNVGATSEDLLSWKQHATFRRFDLDIADIAMRSPDLAKRLLKMSALAVAHKMAQRAIGDSSQAQRASEAVLEASGVLDSKTDDAGYQAMMELRREFATANGDRITETKTLRISEHNIGQ